MSNPAVEMYCGNCNKQLLGGQKFIDYSGRTYHDYCFTCTKCKRSVGTEKFCTQNGHIYCQPDYDELFGVKCGECGGVIDGPMVESSAHESGFLHPECLRCVACGRAIGGEEYFPNEYGVPFCSKECKHRPQPQPAPAPSPARGPTPVVIKVHNDTCSACNQTVYNLDKMDIMNRLWHKKCFKCEVCKAKLTPTTYQGSNGKPYCKVHYPAPTPTSLPL